MANEPNDQSEKTCSARDSALGDSLRVYFFVMLPRLVSLIVHRLGSSSLIWSSLFISHALSLQCRLLCFYWVILFRVIKLLASVVISLAGVIEPLDTLSTSTKLCAARGICQRSIIAVLMKC